MLQGGSGLDRQVSCLQDACWLHSAHCLPSRSLAAPSLALYPDALWYRLQAAVFQPLLSIEPDPACLAPLARSGTAPSELHSSLHVGPQHSMWPSRRVSAWLHLQGLQGAFMPASPTARGGNMRAQQQQLLQQQRQQQELLASLDPRQQAALLAKVCSHCLTLHHSLLMVYAMHCSLFKNLVQLGVCRTAWAGWLLTGLPCAMVSLWCVGGSACAQRVPAHACYTGGVSLLLPGSRTACSILARWRTCRSCIRLTSQAGS